MLSMGKISKRTLFSILTGLALLSCRHDVADLLFDKKIEAPVIPVVTGVTSSNADGTYSTGSPVLIQVVFNTTVIVTGTPQLIIQTGNPATTTLNYTSGSGSSTLTFTYTVANLNSSADLDYDSASAMSLNGGTILGTTGIVAVLTLAVPGAAGSLGANKNLKIDTTVPAPIITGVTSSGTANGTHGVGSVIVIEVTFNTAVNVTGTPQLILSTGNPVTTTINYNTAAPSNILTFTYTVISGNNSLDLDYASTTALQLNGGTIVSTGGTNPAAILTLASPGASGSLGNSKNIVIDAIGPTISGVSASNSDATYGPGSVITIQITFSKTINTTGTGPAQLSLSTGSPATTVVNCPNVSGVTVLNCSYTVASGNVSADLAYASSTALALNGAIIRDNFGNDATLTLPNVGASGSLDDNKNIAIDGIAPTVTSITSSTANDVYTVGQVISIQVVFSESVTIVGPPSLSISTGTPAATSAVYASGSPGTTLNFNYTVGNNNTSADLDYSGVNALAVGTSIQDAYGNNAVLTLPAPGAANSLGANKDIKIDTSQPTVVNVTSAATGNRANSTVNIEVVFSKAVVVTGGPPTLDLKNYAYVLAACTGGNGTAGAWSAAYNSGSGTKNLIFTIAFGSPFLVGDCTNRLDYKATNSLATGGGTIQDLSGINATLTLPTPGSAGSLGMNTNIQVN